MADNVFKGSIQIDPGNAVRAFELVSIGIQTTQRGLSDLQKQIIAFGGGVKSFTLPSFVGLKPIPPDVINSIQTLANSFKTELGVSVRDGITNWNQFVSEVKGPTKAAFNEANKAILSCGDAMKILGKEWANYKNQSLNTVLATKKASEALSTINKVAPAAAAGINKLSSSANASNLVLINTGRIFQDLPFGILGIANNINPLIESFQRLSIQAKATGTSVGRSLLQSLTGPGGLGFAFSIISAAAIFATQGLAFFTRGMGSSGKAAGDAAREIRSVGDVIGDAFASTQSDIARINALAKAATDSSNSFRIQKNAIEELKKINKDYFGDLEAGKSTYEQITKATQDYTKALVQQAIVKGLQEEIGELAKQLRSAAKEYGSLFTSTTKAKENLAQVNREQATNVQGLTAQNREVNLATNRYNSLNAQLVKSGQNLNSLQSDFDNLTKAINASVLKELDLDKFGEKGTKKIKEGVEGIIEQARNLEKQFGTFRLFPALEVGLNIDKAQVLENARKVLKAFEEQNRNPVTALKLIIKPQFDLIEDETKQEDLTNKLRLLTEKQFERLRKAGITAALALRIPITPQFEFSSEVNDAFEKAQNNLKNRKPMELPVDVKFKKGQIDAKELEDIRKQIADTIGQLATDLIATISSGLGEALAGGDLGSIFKGIGNVIGSGLQALGRQMVLLSPVIAALKAAIKTLNPALMLPAGIALIAIGGALRAALSKGIEFRALGGLVNKGGAFIVGERGPELFIPDTGGRIIPNNQLGTASINQGGMNVQIAGEFLLRGNDLFALVKRVGNSQNRLG